MPTSIPILNLSRVFHKVFLFFGRAVANALYEVLLLLDVRKFRRHWLFLEYRR